MSHDMFFQVAAILGLATLVGGIGILLKQPLIVSFLAVGILSGPDGLGLVQQSGTLEFLSHLGIALLLFIVGLKLDVKMIRTVGPVALATGLGQVVFTSVIGFFLSLLLGLDRLPALYVAVALTFSSTIIIVKLLTDKREIDSLHGRIAVGFLIVQDIVVVITLILLSSLGGAVGGDRSLSVELAIMATRGLLFLGVVGLLMKFVLRSLAQKLAKNPELLVLFSITWAVILSETGNQLGFSYEIGAFLAGVSLASTPFKETIGNRLTSLRDFLLLFFFIQLGSGLDLSLLGSLLLPALSLSAFVLIGNPIIVMVIMGAMGYRKRTGFLAGLTVAQISEFSLVLGALGVSIGHVSPQVMGLITLVGLVTIAVSTYMILYSYPIYKSIASVLSLFERKVPFAEQSFENEMQSKRFEVIILGLGRFGNSIAKRLFERNKKVLGVDFDPQIIANWRGAGRSALYGDIEDPDLIEHLPLTDALWVVIAMPMRGGTLEFVKYLRSVGFSGKTAATAQNSNEVSMCRKAGADLVFRPYADAAELAADALTPASDIIKKNLPWPIALEELRLRPSSTLCGKRLGELALRAETGVSIVAVSRAGKTFFDLDAAFQLFPGDRVLLAGEVDQMDLAVEYVKKLKDDEDHTEDSPVPFVTDIIKLESYSPWVQKTLAELDLRRKYGISLIALQRDRSVITTPGAQFQLLEGDQLFVLRGT